MDAIVPRIIWALHRVVDGLEHKATDLETGPEGQHPHLVPLLDPPLGVEVGELVEHQAAGRVAEPVEAHPGRLRHLLRQPHDLGHPLDHCLPAGVDADVVEGGGEVGGLGRLARVEEGEGGGVGVGEELGEREDTGGQGADVRAEVLAGDAEEVLGEGDADVAVGVLLLECCSVGWVVGAMVGAQGVPQLHPGRTPTGRVVGEEAGGGAHSEDAVRHQHRSVVAKIPILIKH